MSDTETPTQRLVKAASKTGSYTDELGRVISIRTLGPIDRMQLIAAAGATNSANAQWMEYAALSAMVTAIDDVPLPKATNERGIMSNVGALGEEGLTAVIIGLATLSGVATDTSPAS